MKMKRIAAYVVTASLGACAISHETYAPDGRMAYSIECSGMAMTWGSCYEKAGEICKNAGYDVLAGGAENGAVSGGGPGGFFAGSAMKRSMLIACHPRS